MENKDKIENIKITHHIVLQHHIFLPPRMIGRICTFWKGGVVLGEVGGVEEEAPG